MEQTRRTGKARGILCGILSLILVLTLGMMPALAVETAEEPAEETVEVSVEQLKETLLAMGEELDMASRIGLSETETDNGTVALGFTPVKELLPLDEYSVLKVDGEIIGATDDRKALELELCVILAEHGMLESNTTTQFVEKIEIVEVPASGVTPMSMEEFRDILTGKTQRTVPYFIHEGDTLLSVAESFGMEAEAFQEINPDFDPDQFELGEKTELEVFSPVVTVKTIRVDTFEEEIDFDTVYEDTDRMYLGTEKIATEGENGKYEFQVEITEMNGKESARRILHSKVLKTPVIQRVLRGTQKSPVTGSYVMPFNGMMSSDYGSRWGGMHTGVDFAGPEGSPIVASDGGQVVYADWKGTYGNCVIIDHGNGLETYYAHCSSLNVTEGQIVKQGEVIAYVGSTGRSTGPHCHYEVRVDGKPVNPWPYLP